MNHDTNHSCDRSRTSLARRILLAMATLMGLGLVMRPEPALALPSNMTEYEYYSDDTFSEVVGYRLANSCYGVVNEVEGEVTPWRIKYTEPCHHANPPTLSYWYCSAISCVHTASGGLECQESQCVLLW